MKKFAVCVLVLVCASSAAMAAGIHDVLAHSSGDWTWFAQIAPGTPSSMPGGSAVEEQTSIFARQDGPGEKWSVLPKLTGRAVALASRSSQLAVLMSKGDWLTLWVDGSATGQPLPADGRLITIADDGKDLWAVGSVKGGIAAANEDLARQRAATQPTTSQLRAEVASTEPAKWSIPHSLPARLVVFHEENGRWSTVVELPADSTMPTREEVSKSLIDEGAKAAAGATPTPEVSLAVIDGSPIVAVRSVNDSVRVIRYGPDHIWTEGGWHMPGEGQTIDAFTILSDGVKPLLWWTAGNGPGELFANASSHAPTAVLKWVSKDTFDGLPAVTFSGDYVCLFGPHAGNVLEQRYKITGEPVETAEPIGMVDQHETVLPVWLEAFFLASMGFAVGAAMHRQWLTQPQQLGSGGSSGAGGIAETSVPAPLLPRLAAGLVDLIPVIAAVAYVLSQADTTHDSLDIPSIRSLVIILSAIALYILHTTVVEMFTGRSLGKWLFGLKVVTIEGAPPSRSQVVIRNLLRIVDPLVMIIVSPLHQRSADTIAGTMVVRVHETLSPENPAGTDADKTDSH